MNVFSLLKSYVPFCVKDKIKVYIIYLYYKFNRKCKAFPIKYHEAADFLYKYGKTMNPSSSVLKNKNKYKKIKNEDFLHIGVLTFRPDWGRLFS